MKKQLILLAALAIAAGASAAPLTPAEALKRAGATGVMRSASTNMSTEAPVLTEMTPSATPAVYAFNLDNGYVIVAADDVAYPVLGYSDSGSIDPENMPAAMKWWLSEYARQIEWAAAKGMRAASAPRVVEGRHAINPLLKTIWDQGAPYNDDCPKSRDNVITYTGCVATSMAQVMNYFKYPEVGEGIKQYTARRINKRLTINFAQKAFDWDNMLDAYYTGQYTDAQAAAVAYLMKACGYSVEMDYGTDSSGAHGFSIAPALRNYFKYDKALSDKYRIVYSADAWDQMMYNNLDAIGPVVMNGQSPLEGGHSFVCDGYDGKGYFHFNWGWSGVSNGYYSLDALNPEAQGIGGMSGGFNFQQNAIFGIRPEPEVPSTVEPSRLFIYGSATGSVSGHKLTFSAKDYSTPGFGNLSYELVHAEVGAIVEPLNGGESVSVAGTLGGRSTVSISQATYYPVSTSSLEVTLPTLADGNYKVYVASRDLDIEGAPWLPAEVAWGASNYVTLTVSNGNYSVTDGPVGTLAFSNLIPLSETYAGKNILFSVDVTNNSDIQLTEGLTPHLINSGGTVQFVGESVLLTYDAGQSGTAQFVSKFYKPDGTAASVSSDTNFTLKLFNTNTGMYYPGVQQSFTLKPSPGAANLMMTKLSMPGLPTEEVTINGRYFPMLAIVTNPADVNLLFSFKNKSGYYDGTVSINLTKMNPDAPYYTLPVREGLFSEMIFGGNDLVREFDWHFDVANDIEQDVVYFFEAVYTQGNSLKTFGTKAFIYKDFGGVEGVTADQESVQYYDLNGFPVAEPKKGMLLIMRRGGKASKVIF